MDATEIQQLLGTQLPLNLLDKVISLDPNISLKAIANISANEAFFRGHFPNNPVMPGVLIIETMVEGAKILLGPQRLNLGLTQIKKARFRKMVRPGDQMIIKLEMKDLEQKILCAHALVEGEVACSAELSFS